MNDPNTIFPFRAVLSGGVRGWSKEDFLNLCGRPHEVEGDLYIYRFDQDVPAGTIGEPDAVVIQILLVDDCVGHAWLRLRFADNLDYQEVLW